MFVCLFSPVTVYECDNVLEVDVDTNNNVGEKSHYKTQFTLCEDAIYSKLDLFYFFHSWDNKIQVIIYLNQSK